MNWLNIFTIGAVVCGLLAIACKIASYFLGRHIEKLHRRKS
jgi:hypothetical protein